jgi:hypothetical protein
VSHRFDALQVKVIQHAQVERPHVDVMRPTLPHIFWQCGNLLICEGIQVEEYLYAACLALCNTADTRVGDIIAQVLSALNSNLVLEGVYPNVSALAVVSKLRIRNDERDLGERNRHSKYPLTEAAVALDYMPLVAVQRVLDLECGCHGPTMAASVVGLALGEPGRLGFRTRIRRRHVLGIQRITVEPGQSRLDAVMKMKKRGMLTLRSLGQRH